jgi:hypothetical protein
LLNCYEFSHLTSIVEQGLKTALVNSTANGLVSAAFRQYPKLDSHLRERWGIGRDFFIKIWDLYLYVRNMYAHSFGFVDEKNIKQIQAAREKALSAINSLDLGFHSSAFKPEQEFFPKSEFIVGQMYLLNDIELNIYRNFTRMFMPALSKQRLEP